MKVVINRCYGGFNLSPKAIKRYAELKNIPCFLFSFDADKKKHVLIDEEKAYQLGLWAAFNIENPDELMNFQPEETFPPEGLEGAELEEWKLQQDIELQKKRTQHQEIIKSHIINPEKNRAEIELIQTVEELGLESSGQFSSLAVVEIPDDIDWILVNNSGKEHIAEKHRIWE